MAEFEISRRDRGGVTVLQLKGQLDAHTFPSLQRELEELVAAEDAQVVLDCADLDYISSAGLGVLKKMTREFRGLDGDLRLAALTPKINSVVTLLGFDQVLRVFPDSDQAVESYR